MNTIKKRGALIASLLNFVFLGLGFLYVGRPIYAVALALSLLLLPAVGAWTNILFIPLGMLAVATTGLLIWLGSTVAAALIARRQPQMELKKYQRWYVYVCFIVITSIAGNVMASYRGEYWGYETFRFPSNAMDGTLLAGDYFVSNTWKYRSQSPQRGDLIVFRALDNPGTKLVKRVIGLPGDHIEIKDGVLLVNGSPLDEPYVKPENNRRSSKESTSYQVPETGYFVMGDNRDNSRDSRHWGSLPKENVYGSVEFVWFSFDAASGIRKNRIGQYVK